MFNVRYFSSAFTIFSFFIIATFGALLLSSRSHVHGCPFMPDETAVCAMTELDHVAILQKIFSVTWPNFFLILTPIIFLFSIVLLPELNSWLYSKSYRREKNYLLELFSSGLLNARIP